MPTIVVRHKKENLNIFYEIHGAEATDNPEPVKELRGNNLETGVPSAYTTWNSQFNTNAGEGVAYDGGVEDFTPAAASMANTEVLAAEKRFRPIKILLIAGLSARGNTEFYEKLIEHFAAMTNASGKKYVSICTFDNRGIGNSSTPLRKRDYSIGKMARDGLALLEYLGWTEVHVIGMSMGGMIATKLAAISPNRVKTLTLLSTTRHGTDMMKSTALHPVITTLAGTGPQGKRILSNLKCNYSKTFLDKQINGKSNIKVLEERTLDAIKTGNTRVFMAENQKQEGRMGQLLAAARYRLSRDDVVTIRKSGIKCQVISGRHDIIARVSYSRKLAEAFKSPLLIVEAAHAGLIQEHPVLINGFIERIIF